MPEPILPPKPALSAKTKALVGVVVAVAVAILGYLGVPVCPECKCPPPAADAGAP